ncbi:prolyl endopeptidase-like [Planococcus citri]|uniref:prolyl endopeptidase-like n=1 Tax=Planococcus citri TaxID=170843 RepID=UPI0031FA3269
MVTKSFIIGIFLGAVFRCVVCAPDQGNPGGCGGAGDISIAPDKYPNTRRDETISATYGTCNVVVKDPYQWMEKINDADKKVFYDAQAALTRPFLDKAPFRTEIEARLKELNDVPKYQGPYKAGNKYFSFQNTGTQNQDVFFVQDALNAEGKPFIDPNSLSKDGSIGIDFSTSAFSPNGQIFAYSLSPVGSDRMEVHFKDVEKGDDVYKEILKEVRDTTLQWTIDNKGIFYGRYLGDSPEHESVQNQKIYYHVVGTDQSKDILVVEFPKEPDYQTSIKISEDGKYLVVFPTKELPKTLVYVVDLEKIQFKIDKKLDLIPIVTKIEAEYEFITNHDKILIFKTNKDAGNYKLATIDMGCPDPSTSWKDLVPENKEDVLDWALAVFEKYLLLSYLHKVKAELELHELESGKLVKKFDLKEMGTIEYISGDKISNEFFFKLVTFTCPGIVYRCDLSKPDFNLEVYKQIQLKNFKPENFITEQVFYKSKDGTEVPMFIIHKKCLQKTGNNGAHLLGFGAFADKETPFFSIKTLTFIDNLDGVFAVANIRGGGELGEPWHAGGSLDKKQNTFDDFQAAAEFLINEKYTSSKLLSIIGGNSGGLLVGACLNQKPDLYGAAVIVDGLLDMLRYNVFTEDGKTWVSEFGSAADPKQFEYIFKYSPLQNIKLSKDCKLQYPPTLLTTADDSNRRPHAFKHISTLQFDAKQCSLQTNPLLIHVKTTSGNGSNRPTDKQLEDYTDILSFIVHAVGLKFQATKTA